MASPPKGHAGASPSGGASGAHGPYCGYCGACKVHPDVWGNWCWDSENHKHRWNRGPTPAAHPETEDDWADFWTIYDAWEF